MSDRLGLSFHEGELVAEPDFDHESRVLGAPDRSRVTAISRIERSPLPMDAILKVHEYERQRMGRELHDSAGQLITSLELNIAILRQVGDKRLTGHVIDEIHATVQQMSREIRTLAFLDYPSQISDGGLCAALRSLSRGLEHRTGLNILVRCESGLPDIDDKRSLPLLRVAQEALTNVHRHARATEAKIILRHRRGMLELIISDNGRGMREELAHPENPGVGLRGMRHRIEAIGGQFRIVSSNAGTRISACVPLRA